LGEGYISCVAIELQHDGVAVRGVKIDYGDSCTGRGNGSLKGDCIDGGIIAKIEINRGRRRSAGPVGSTLSRYSGARPAIDGSCFEGERGNGGEGGIYRKYGRNLLFLLIFSRLSSRK